MSAIADGRLEAGSSLVAPVFDLLLAARLAPGTVTVACPATGQVALWALVCGSGTGFTDGRAATAFPGTLRTAA